MDFHLLEWINFLFRWLHVITAIAWVGASFYFVWLDLNLETPPDWKDEKGIKGDLWAFHGGGIYEVSKYKLAPQQMPKTLHWFKWEAYGTWITGTILLIVMYYFNADLYLVDSSKWIKTKEWSIAASVLFIAFGIFVYTVLFHFFGLSKQITFSISLVIFIGFSCYLSVNIFSNRAAFLHVGAMIASIMAANVYFGIIPAQKNFISLLEQNKNPEMDRMLRAQKRSLHNNYLTLPVLICMLSNHYPFVYGHSLNWIALYLLMGASAYGRHYFNLKHQGANKPEVLVVAGAIAILVVALMPLSSYVSDKTTANSSQSSIDTRQSQYKDVIAPALSPSPNVPTDQQSNNGEDRTTNILAMTETHCGACHDDKPSFPGISAPPLGLTFNTIESIHIAKDKILTSLQTNYMPLGNVTKMTAEERSKLIEQINQL
jgi:uncharacterized membrane protein